MANQLHGIPQRPVCLQLYSAGFNLVPVYICEQFGVKIYEIAVFIGEIDRFNLYRAGGAPLQADIPAFTLFRFKIRVADETVTKGEETGELKCLTPVQPKTEVTRNIVCRTKVIGGLGLKPIWIVPALGGLQKERRQ